jgi:hypothetical protein
MASATRYRTLTAAALATGAAVLLLFPLPARAGSCCGGGGSGALVLPAAMKAMVDVTAEFERYHGFWNQEGDHTPDPPGSDLNQYRLDLAAAGRISRRWQAGIFVPYVWNVNDYSGVSSRTDGIGDSSLSVWYAAIEERSAWKITEPLDLVPSVTVGPSLTIPTGISPYDDVSSSFDVTGRGFYRIDGNLLVEKTYQPVNASLSASWGRHVERPVNREYGKYTGPYRKRLGDRTSLSASAGYTLFLGTKGDKVTGTASFAYLEEGKGEIDGHRDPTSGFRKSSVGASLAWGSTDHDWSVRASWNHAIRQDGWGESFPTTDIYSLGVRYGIR